MTDAEIAGIMGWRGPGAYTKASLQKIRAIIERVCANEREACAKVCDELERAKWNSVHNALTNGGRLEFAGPMACAAAIRNRAPTHQPAPQTSGKERADLAKAEHIEWREEEARLALVHAAGRMPGRGAR